MCNKIRCSHNISEMTCICTVILHMYKNHAEKIYDSQTKRL